MIKLFLFKERFPKNIRYYGELYKEIETSLIKDFSEPKKYSIFAVSSGEYKDFLLNTLLEAFNTILGIEIIHSEILLRRLNISKFNRINKIENEIVVSECIKKLKGKYPYLFKKGYQRLLSEASMAFMKNPSIYKKDFEDDFLDSFFELYKESVYKNYNVEIDKEVKYDKAYLQGVNKIFLFGNFEEDENFIKLLTLLKEENVETYIISTKMYKKSKDIIGKIIYSDYDEKIKFSDLKKALTTDDSLCEDISDLTLLEAASVESEINFVLSDVKNEVLKNNEKYSDSAIYLINSSYRSYLLKEAKKANIALNINTSEILKDYFWKSIFIEDISSFFPIDVNVSEFLFYSKNYFEKVLRDNANKDFIIDEVLSDFKNYTENLFLKSKINEESIINLNILESFIEVYFNNKVVNIEDGIYDGLNIFPIGITTPKRFKNVYVMGIDNKSFSGTNNNNFILKKIIKDGEIYEDNRSLDFYLGYLEDVFVSAENKLIISYSTSDMQESSNSLSYIVSNIKGIENYKESVGVNYSYTKNASFAINKEEREIKNFYQKDIYKDIDAINIIREGIDIDDKKKYPEYLESYNGFLDLDIIRYRVNNFLDKAISVSAIDAYLSCPFNFLMTYILNLATFDEKAQQNLNYGSFLHNILDMYYSNFLNKEIDLDCDYLNRIIDNNFDSYFKKESSNYFFNKKSIAAKLANLIDKDIIRQKKNNTVIISTESSYSKSIFDGDKEYIIKAKIDRIDRHIERKDNFIIYDYKKSIYSINKFQNFENKKSVQLPLYGMIFKDVIKEDIFLKLAYINIKNAEIYDFAIDKDAVFKSSISKGKLPHCDFTAIFEIAKDIALEAIRGIRELKFPFYINK